MDNSSLAHCKWECQYHIVFIPKFRKKKLYGTVRDNVREIIRTLCKYKKVEIIVGAVCADHVHLCVSIPPKLSASEFVGYLKGKSALMIFDKHLETGRYCSVSYNAGQLGHPGSEVAEAAGQAYEGQFGGGLRDPRRRDGGAGAQGGGKGRRLREPDVGLCQRAV